ncbi:MAG: response regulator [Pirellulales bacterium]|nr:response regulator [Pirellulales bacterium]
MVTTLQPRKPENRLEVRAWRQLPPRMRVLYIATHERTGGWLAEALESDSAVEIEIVEAPGTASGMVQLRDEVFDAVLVSHLPGELDALDLIEGYRAGGADEPILVLGTQSEQEMAALCFEVGADGYLCVHTATTRNLLWTLARAVQRHQLLRENHRLSLAEQTRLQREHDEADKLISQQRALIGDLEALRQGDPRDKTAFLHLPDELILHYRELLRTYVIMGSGNLGGELKRLAEMLVAAGMSAPQTMQLHLRAVEELVHGLGARSSRHVMTRADLLGLEVMVHLAEGYRRRYEEKIHPPRQQILPGFA